MENKSDINKQYYSDIKHFLLTAIKNKKRTYVTHRIKACKNDISEMQKKFNNLNIHQFYLKNYSKDLNSFFVLKK